jgi:UDP-N-acetylmuramate dehydrogenase
VVTADTYAGLVRTVRVLTEQGVPWVVLGRGSNVLAADAGYRGCVVRLGREFSRISVDGCMLTSGAAVLLPKLVNESLSRELSGLESCAGIPGTVGGAVSMDAGSRHQWIGRVVRDVVTFKPGVGMRRHLGSEVEWGYRWCSIPADEIILEATFELTPSTKQAVAAEMNRRMARRRATQPIGKPCCGSVFKNPGDRSVGALLDSCGVKGMRVGGACVSERHANFVVNEGGARRPMWWASLMPCTTPSRAATVWT